MTTLNTRDPAVAADLSTAVPVATVVAAPYSAEGPIVAGTSDSQNSIDTVTNKTFVIKEYNRSFFPGTRVRATAIGFTNVWLEGIVVAWDGQTVTIDGDLSSGTGVYSSWQINVAGQPGQQGLTGTQGPKGDAGGPTGPAGPTGPPGSVWRTGTGAPNNSLGVNGDYYLDDATDNVWLRASNAYSVVANIGGQQGVQGVQGPIGPQGIIPEAPVDGGFYARRNGSWESPPGGGNVSAVNAPVAGQMARWTSSNTIEGFTITNFAPISSPVFLGDPQAPTPPVGDNDTSIATTAFVKSQGYAVSVSPVFTGTPQAPTPPPGDNSTAIATTEFVRGYATPETTGDIRLTLKTAADPGWLMFDDGSIGSASSGATFANSAAQNLFNLLFANTNDTWCPIKTSTGANTTRAAQTNAATAWSNNCRMFLPKMLGRALAVAGTGSGLSARSLGQTAGQETVTQDTSTLAQHSHFDNVGVGGFLIAYGANANMSFTGANSIQAASLTYNGGSAPMPNIQPTTFLNVMVKL